VIYLTPGHIQSTIGLSKKYGIMIIWGNITQV